MDRNDAAPEQTELFDAVERWLKPSPVRAAIIGYRILTSVFINVLGIGDD